MIKKYIRIKFELVAPLSLGSGFTENTDKDLMVDGRGVPFIPGSSLAGIYRNMYQNACGEAKTNSYFGEVEIATKANQDTKASSSRIITYDATLLEESNSSVSKRDCVGLDEYKTAKQGAKFDFEVLDAGTKFVTYLEQNMNPGEEDIISVIAKTWENEGLSIGAKTQRGFGKTKVAEIKEASFDFAKTAEKEAWLDFDLYEDGGWSDYKGTETFEKTQNYKLTLKLAQRGGISIREYSTDVNTEDGAKPDYRQKTVKREGKEYAIIPGTSWSGAFRHQMVKLGLTKEEEKELFGTHEKAEAKKSQIAFSESEILIGKDAAQKKTFTRNAIDRFTGGTVDGALYTEEFVYGGTTELSITLPKTSDARVKGILAAAVMDLHQGILAVGGLTSVGRGVFEIKEINGNQDMTDVYKTVTELLA